MSGGRNAVYTAGTSCMPGGGLGEILDGAAERGRPAQRQIPVSGPARVSTASRISPSLTTKATNPSPQVETHRANPKWPTTRRAEKLNACAGLIRMNGCPSPDRRATSTWLPGKLLYANLRAFAPRIDQILRRLPASL